MGATADNVLGKHMRHRLDPAKWGVLLDESLLNVGRAS